MYDALYFPYKEETVMVQKYSEKATSPKKQNKGEKRKNHMCGCWGVLCISKNEEQRFDIFPPDWGILRRSRCLQIFLRTIERTAAPSVLL